LPVATELKPKRKPRAPSAIIVSPVTEWTDYRGLLELFALRRSTAYHMVETIPELKAATISLKGPGEKRGLRRFHVPTFRRFFASRMERQQ
jgi:hypothetical protein